MEIGPNEELKLDINELSKIHKNKVDKLASASSLHYSIFKVPRQLREVNEKAYTPQLISIGPYHRDRSDLQAMEIHKVGYLEKLLKRIAHSESHSAGTSAAHRIDSLESLVAIISMDQVKKASDFYENKVKMNATDFVMMMVLDGCFIVELIRKFMYPNWREKDDALFKLNMNLVIVAQDLLMLENQLPFFVLDHLFRETKQTTEHSFSYMALHFFSEIMLVPGLLYSENLVLIGYHKHLLGLVHDNWLLSTEALYSEELQAATGKWKFMRSATELLELGIQFKKRKENNLFAIRFKKGVLYIPTLIVNHETEGIFRNLIAYEQFNQGSSSIVMDYTRLMDCLINYDSDVVFLSENGIIDNRLGSNDAVANMFNKLNDYVYLSTADYYYSDIFDGVNDHYRGRWNKWKLKLKAKYSHTPWDWILVSIIAATILLLLALAQTLFSVLDYVK